MATESSKSSDLILTTKTKQNISSNTKERVISSVPPPIATLLDSKVLFGTDDQNVWDGATINVEALKSHLIGEGKLHKDDVIRIIKKTTEIMSAEPNLLRIQSPVCICGDTHGQFYDLIKLFDVGGVPGGNATYLFLGDYVDRGSYSIEIVLLLFTLKILHPTKFFLLRGNHECRHLTQYFTFKSECTKKYGEEIYDLIMESFDALPLAAIVDNQFFCVHGGISPDIEIVDEINDLDRFIEVPEAGPMCDLLWADPLEKFNATVRQTFIPNDVRGCSYFYSHRAVCDFLKKNGLLCLIRAHEVQQEGYRIYQKNDETGFPSMITMFSAPNYLDAYNNKGAVLWYSQDVMDIRQFTQSPHPYYLPNFMDVFTWSLPFVTEKVGQILLAILNLMDDEEEDEEHETKQELQLKVKSVGRLLQMHKDLRQEREMLVLLKSFTPENKIPAELLSEGVDAVKMALGNFEKAKSLDAINEKRPASPITSNGISNNAFDLPVDSKEKGKKPKLFLFSLKDSNSSVDEAKSDATDSLSTTPKSPPAFAVQGKAANLLNLIHKYQEELDKPEHISDEE